MQFQSLVKEQADIVLLVYSLADYTIRVRIVDSDTKSGIYSIDAFSDSPRMPEITSRAGIGAYPTTPIDCVPIGTTYNDVKTLDDYRQVIAGMEVAARVAEEMSKFDFYEDYFDRRNFQDYSLFMYVSNIYVDAAPLVFSSTYESACDIRAQIENTVDVVANDVASSVDFVETSLADKHCEAANVSARFMLDFKASNALSDGQIDELRDVIRQATMSRFESLLDGLSELYVKRPEFDSVEVETPKLYRLDA